MSTNNTHCKEPPGGDPDDITIVINDDSLHSIDNHDNDPSCRFPSCNDVSSNAGSGQGWSKYLADCAPSSFKDLVSPMRHDEEDCPENNDIVMVGEKWFNHTICGRECDGDNLKRISPSFRISQSEYENDWDFGYVEDEGGVKSGGDAFSLCSILP